MAITGINDIASGLANGQHINVFKSITAAKAAGAFQSAWFAAGNPTSASLSGSYGGGVNYVSASSTRGAIPVRRGLVQNYLGSLTFTATQAGTLIIADRLWSCNGMGFAAGTYTIVSPGNLPSRAATTGSVTTDTELWIEQNVAAGAASGSLTAWYVSDYGQPNRVGSIAAVVSAPVVGQLQPVLLQIGDTGISQLTAVNTAATWTSGCFGAVILKRIAEVEIPVAAIGKTMDWASLGLPSIPVDACLMILWLATGTTAPVVLGSIDIIDK